MHQTLLFSDMERVTLEEGKHIKWTLNISVLQGPLNTCFARLQPSAVLVPLFYFFPSPNSCSLLIQNCELTFCWSPYMLCFFLPHTKSRWKKILFSQRYLCQPVNDIFFPNYEDLKTGLGPWKTFKHHGIGGRSSNQVCDPVEGGPISLALQSE